MERETEIRKTRESTSEFTNGWGECHFTVIRRSNRGVDQEVTRYITCRSKHFDVAVVKSQMKNFFHYFLCSVKMASIYQTAIDQELNHLATQASSFLDRLYPAGKLAQVCVFLYVNEIGVNVAKEAHSQQLARLLCHDSKVIHLQFATTVNNNIIIFSAWPQFLQTKSILIKLLLF